MAFVSSVFVVGWPGLTNGKTRNELRGSSQTAFGRNQNRLTINHVTPDMQSLGERSRGPCAFFP